MPEQVEKFNSTWSDNDWFVKERQEEIKDIVAAVEKTEKYPGTKPNDIIATTDVEGCPKSFLCKLKAAGMIDSVSLGEKTDRLNIKLNKNWRGALAFCGDLTAYKGFPLYTRTTEGWLGNEIIIEVFEELLDQLEKHNEQIIKDNKELLPEQRQEEAKFVAAPGNHEFLRYCGCEDMYPFMDGTRSDLKEENEKLAEVLTPQHALKVKVRAARVIAKIQRYHFKQALRNGYDINDDDYGDRYGDAFASLTRYIKELDKYIEDCEKLLKDIDDPTQWKTTISTKLKNICKESINRDTAACEVWEENTDFGSLDVLKFRHNKLFSKMMLCHRGQKLRLLHSLTLFAPTNKFPSQSEWLWDDPKSQYIGKYHKLNPELSDNINYNLANYGGITKKYFRDYDRNLDHSAFSENKISTIWGHTGKLLDPDYRQVCIDNKTMLGGRPKQYLFYIEQDGKVFRVQVGDSQTSTINEEDNPDKQELQQYCELTMQEAKQITGWQGYAIVDNENDVDGGVIRFQNNNNVQNNRQGNIEPNQSPKQRLAKDIITAVINGDDTTLEGLRQQFYRSHIDNDFLISALRDYNGENHNVIKRYSWCDKFWSLGENTARKRRINHLGKMLNGCFTRNMNKRRKQQYQQAIQRYNNKKTKPSVAQMNSISFDNLLSIAKIHSRWPCCCCGRGSVEVK